MRVFGPNVRRLERQRDMAGLVEALGDRDEKVQVAAHEAILRLGDDGTEALCDATGHASAGVRERATCMLKAIGMPAVAPLSRRLSHRDSSVRAATERLLFELANQTKPVEASLPALLALLRGSREGAVAAAHRLGAIGEPATAPLLERLRDDSDGVRELAAVALGDIGGAASPAALALVELLSDRSQNVRWEARKALDRIGTAAIDAAQLARLKQEDSEKYATALCIMGQAGLSGLVELSADPLPDRRLVAVQALGKVDAPLGPAVPALVDRLDDDVLEVRLGALKALARRGDEAHAAVPGLQRLVHDVDPRVRLASAQTLAALGQRSAAVSALDELVNRSDSGVVNPAAWALRDIGETPRVVRAFMLQLLADDIRYRRNAAYELRQLGTSAARAVPLLARALLDSEHDVVSHAASALAEMGRHAWPAALLIASQTKDLAVREVALSRIEPRLLGDPLSVVRWQAEQNLSLLANGVWCRQCSKPDAAAEWPRNGDHVPFYIQNEAGRHSLKVTCWYCEHVYYVVWDEDPGPVSAVLYAGPPPRGAPL